MNNVITLSELRKQISNTTSKSILKDKLVVLLTPFLFNSSTWNSFVTHPHVQNLIYSEKPKATDFQLVISLLIGKNGLKQYKAKEISIISDATQFYYSINWQQCIQNKKMCSRIIGQFIYDLPHLWTGLRSQNSISQKKISHDHINSRQQIGEYITSLAQKNTLNCSQFLKIIHIGTHIHHVTPAENIELRYNKISYEDITLIPCRWFITKMPTLSLNLMHSCCEI